MAGLGIAIEQFIEQVWTRGNADFADGRIADSYTIYHDPGDPWDGMTLDLAGFKERVVASRASFPDQTFRISEMMEDAERVLVTWFWTGTHRGELAGLAPTGRSIYMSGMTIYYADDGLFSGHWQLADRLSVWQQLQQPEGNPG